MWRDISVSGTLGADIQVFGIRLRQILQSLDRTVEQSSILREN